MPPVQRAKVSSRTLRKRPYSHCATPAHVNSSLSTIRRWSKRFVHEKRGFQWAATPESHAPSRGAGSGTENLSFAPSPLLSRNEFQSISASPWPLEEINPMALDDERGLVIDLVCFIRPPHKIIFVSSRFPDHPPNHSRGPIFVVTNLLPDLMTVLLIVALESTSHPEEENISQGTPSSLGNVPLADPVGTLRACDDAVPERRGFHPCFCRSRASDSFTPLSSRYPSLSA